MPSWWTRKSERVAQKDYHSKKCMDKATTKSFDEKILLLYRRNSLDFKPPPPIFDSDFAAVKKAYPLPVPLFSPEPLINLDRKLGFFSSETAFLSITTSPLCFSPPSSSSSVSSSDDDDCDYDEGVDPAANDHADFASFRITEEKNCTSFPASSCPGSETPLIQASPLPIPQLWDVRVDSPSEKHENKTHPCHPLPLPPVKSSEKSNWKKGKLLGRGTFGHVYAAFNSENGQICAVKEVRVISDDKNSTQCLKQLNQEIALLSELSHPNIVQYYGSEMVGDKLSVYLEYVSGGSIQKLLNEYGPFAEPVIRNYTKQILCGLAYLHKRNTVHRDIKGANILVDPNGEIKLVDFGMAKHIKSVSSMLSFKGSPYWMAPEVITNTSSYNLAVDIWSLGCTILEMASAKPPWSEFEGVAAIFKIANSSDCPEIPNYLSEDAQSFIKLCLQRDPMARPSAAKLLHHPFIQNQDTREAASAYSVDKQLAPYSRHLKGASCFHSQQLISPKKYITG